MMVGLDPYGTPHNKGALLFASYISGTFGAAFMLLLAFNASNIAGHRYLISYEPIILQAPLLTMFFTVKK